ncbi:hypothetical protein E1286_37275, partial [Nonomuraea terrae]
MDTPPHHLGLERVVEVYSGHDTVVGVTGSGYAIGADLVLASGHVVDPAAPCQVRASGSARWVAAEEVWRGRGGSAGAVLLRACEPLGARFARLSWAELTPPPGARTSGVPEGGRPSGACGVRRSGSLRCVARGFPQAWQRDGVRDAESVSGLVDAPMSVVSKALAFQVLDPAPQSMPVSLWHGMAGAALLAGQTGHLIGLITTDHTDHRTAPTPADRAGRLPTLTHLPGPIATDPTALGAAGFPDLAGFGR